MASNAFLPDNYEIPSSASRYVGALPKGESKFRILSAPLMGNKYWTDNGGKPAPVRLKMGAKINANDVAPDRNGEPGRVSHFWAMPVWDYESSSVKIWEVTQKAIQKALMQYAGNSKWGSPTGYDIVVTRKGDGLETEYSLIAEPAEPLNPEAAAAWKAVQAEGFELEALFAGADPFTADPISGEITAADIEAAFPPE